MMTTGGYDWYVADRPGATPVVGLTLGYGLIHEPLTEVGTLGRLVGAIQAELARPIEIEAGRVTAPEVRVEVQTDTTDIIIRGDHDTAQAAWRRLAEIFAGRHPLDEATPAGTRVTAAPRDLTSRFGYTPLTVAAYEKLEVRASGDTGRLLAQLNPAAGAVRCTMHTNTLSLAGTGFAPPREAPPTRPEPSRLRPDAQHGTLEFPPGWTMFSTVVPRTAAGSVAIRVLAHHLSQQLNSVTRRDDGVTVALAAVGPDMMATVMAPAVPTDAEREAVLGLFVGRPLPDHRIAEATEWERENGTANRTIERRALNLPVEDGPSIDAVRQAVAQAWRTMRLYLSPGVAAPRGYEPAIPTLPQPTGERFRSRAAKDVLTIGSQVLEIRRHGGKNAPDSFDRVDLTDLAVVLDDESATALLIDSQHRLVDVPSGVFAKEKQLTEALASATAGTPRLKTSGAADPTAIRGRVKARRKLVLTTVLAPIAVIAFAVVMSFVDDYIQREPAAPTPVEVAIRFDETAMLGNGSRVTVGDLTLTPSAVVGSDDLTVSVEYCAARDDAVNPAYFRLLHGNPLLPAGPMPAADQLTARPLTAGACATGNLRYLVPDDATTFVVDLHTPAGDDVSWGSR